MGTPVAPLPPAKPNGQLRSVDFRAIVHVVPNSNVYRQNLVDLPGQISWLTQEIIMATQLFQDARIPNQKTEDSVGTYDVVICGGDLAGIALARQLNAWAVSLDVDQWEQDGLFSPRSQPRDWRRVVEPLRKNIRFSSLVEVANINYAT